MPARKTKTKTKKPVKKRGKKMMSVMMSSWEREKRRRLESDWARISKRQKAQIAQEGLDEKERERLQKIIKDREKREADRKSLQDKKGAVQIPMDNDKKLVTYIKKKYPKKGIKPRDQKSMNKLDSAHKKLQRTTMKDLLKMLKDPEVKKYEATKTQMKTKMEKYLTKPRDTFRHADFDTTMDSRAHVISYVRTLYGGAQYSWWIIPEKREAMFKRFMMLVEPELVEIEELRKKKPVKKYKKLKGQVKKYLRLWDQMAKKLGYSTDDTVEVMIIRQVYGGWIPKSQLSFVDEILYRKYLRIYVLDPLQLPPLKTIVDEGLHV